ncbi:hypothetical protein AAGS40_18535 [Paraburkholderia sp. PREW-6R]|uniref:hypothetical protein n=1 Tax=Paraburkholderia sp. PREW-6R TaxID=3141544 RepID=UPI0031F5DA5C
MKDKFLFFLFATVPVILFSIVFFSNCDGFLVAVRRLPNSLAVLLVLSIAVFSAVSIIYAIFKFFRIYAIPGSGGLLISRRLGIAIAVTFAIFLVGIKAISDRICSG